MEPFFLLKEGTVTDLYTIPDGFPYMVSWTDGFTLGDGSAMVGSSSWMADNVISVGIVRWGGVCSLGEDEDCDQTVK
jgi:hypothetical protein